MATYFSDAGGLRFQPYSRPEGGLIGQPFSLTISVAVANADIFVLARVPNGATVIGYTVDVPAVDSNASPTATVALGDANTSTQFVNSAVMLNTGFYRFTSWVSPTAIAGLIDGADTSTLPRAYTNSNDFRMTVTSAVATGVSTGTIKGTLFYTMQPFYSDPKL